MSTLRINNIEAQSVPASPTIDEKVKVTNSLILFALLSVFIQVLFVVYYSQNNEIGSFSLFYNIVNLFVLTFLYIYRNEMQLNYYLYWSFALLFLMGMEIRSIQTIGLGLN